MYIMSTCGLPTTAGHENLYVPSALFHSICSTAFCPYCPPPVCPYCCLYLPICSSLSKLINAVVLLILLTALSDPEQYHLTSAELANDLDVMDDASK